MVDKIKLKGHESFSIREGWLSKGLFAVKENESVFLDKNVTEILGVGSNMVKSIKYWMITSNLIRENKKGKYVLSDFGEMIYKYDPYFENIFSLYMLHYYIILNKDKAYVWNLFFNKCFLKNFSKKDVFEQIKTLLDLEGKEYNEKILLDEINVMFKTYTFEGNKTDTPENNFTCPLTELCLINKSGKDLYTKAKANMSKLNYLNVYWGILMSAIEDSISIDDLLNSENSVCIIFNLDKNILNEYLDQMKKEKLIVVNRTAGLNMVYINKKLTLEEIFIKYYGKEY